VGEDTAAHLAVLLGLTLDAGNDSFLVGASTLGNARPGFGHGAATGFNGKICAGFGAAFSLGVG